MPYAAITYNIKPGFEDEIAEVFARFQRVTSPVLKDEAGREVGKLKGTGVFIRDGVLVRFIDYDGEIEDVGRHMSEHPGVHSIEEALKPYLSEPRDTATPERFRAYFAKSLMRCIQQFSGPPKQPAPAG
ncbi:MAG TPA: SchA/CurD-like domain-containing protein [Streptosporangiaceae bacterium]|nr:SchA/CurD-like domain-containing protein [Streptosporangiaceae bacterium]